MGRGQWGEGFTGTTIKDTWTKSRGRVEAGEGGGFGWCGVEGWGITIKILKNTFSFFYSVYFIYLFQNFYSVFFYFTYWVVVFA